MGGVEGDGPRSGPGMVLIGTQGHIITIQKKYSGDTSLQEWLWSKSDVTSARKLCDDISTQLMHACNVCGIAVKFEGFC